MKYRDRETGEVYKDIFGAQEALCRRTGECVRCILCDYDFGSKNKCGDCFNWVGKHPEEAADLMGFEVIRDDDTERTEYQEKIIALMDRQHAKGLAKYGETLEENKTLSSEQRIEHLQEELIDGLQYCEHIKAVLTDSLTANDYQRMAMRTADENKDTYLDNAIMGLCGEVGECADIVKKHRFQGHELDREHLIDELSDVCWYVALLATALDTPLENVMRYNIAKLMQRYPDGFDKERSINREE